MGSGVAVVWCRPAAAAPIQPLAWELPYAMGVAIKRRRRRKKSQAEPDRQTCIQIPDPLSIKLCPLNKLLHLSELICNMRVLDPKTSDFPSGSQFGDSVDT